VNLANAAQPTPTTPSPSPSPTEYNEERVDLSGQDSVQRSDQTSPTAIKRYIVSVERGQQLSVEVQQGDVSLTIRNPNGRVVQGASGARFWQAQVNRTGEYQIDMIANQPTNFSVNIGVGNGGQ
jgi:serine/threonine-protein kinase